MQYMRHMERAGRGALGPEKAPGGAGWPGGLGPGGREPRAAAATAAGGTAPPPPGTSRPPLHAPVAPHVAADLLLVAAGEARHEVDIGLREVLVGGGRWGGVVVVVVVVVVCEAGWSTCEWQGGVGCAGGGWEVCLRGLGGGGVCW